MNHKKERPWSLWVDPKTETLSVSANHSGSSPRSSLYRLLGAGGEAGANP